MSISILAGLIRDDRAAKAVFGLGREKMEELGKAIERLYREKLEKREGRQRALGGGRKGKSPSGVEKAAFILF